MYSTLTLLSTLLPLLLAPLTHASPTARRDTTLTDAQLLQFALAFENIENTFYSQALSQYSNQSFDDAGFPQDAYGRFQQIAKHESTHVTFLTETLEAMGETVPEACNYSFSSNDPVSFAQLSQTFEGIGTSAYLGAANLLQNKTLVTASGAILTTEARQNAWINSYILGSFPWSGPYDTPLSSSLAYSLIKPYVVSCPSSTPALPITDFPTLTISNGTANGDGNGNATQNVYTNVTSGDQINLSFAANSSSNGTQGESQDAAPGDSPSTDFFLAFKHGLTTSYVPLEPSSNSSSNSSADDGSGSNSTGTNGSESFTATLPNLQGTVYAFVTNLNVSEGANVPDSEIVSGAQTLRFALPANVDDSNQSSGGQE